MTVFISADRIWNGYYDRVVRSHDAQRRGEVAENARFVQMSSREVTAFLEHHQCIS